MHSTRVLRTLLTAVALVAATGVRAAQATPKVEGTPVSHVADTNGWIRLFDGKTLSGWQTFDPGSWSVDKDGLVVGKGPRSHLFSPNAYTNLQFKVEVKLNAKGNSGMYFRAKLGPGWPEGYEAQVENTSPDPQKTGSLYNRAKVLEQLIQDDTWWTQHVIAIGNRIVIKVNDKVVVDFIDEKNSFRAGYLALQQHDPGSLVHYRNVMVRPLPDDPMAAYDIAKVDMPGTGLTPPPPPTAPPARK